MKRLLLLPLLLLSAASLRAEMPAKPQVAIETNLGTIVVALDRDRAPVTVDNFINYVTEGFYDGTIFHRVIRQFMIQGGGYTKDYTKKNTHAPIENEANNGLHNKRGTIAMARTSLPHSATAQFFINTVNNDFLDHTAKTQQGWGYTVFGEVVEGMEVVDQIEQTRTSSGGPFPRDVPRDPIVIQRAHLLQPGEATSDPVKAAE